MAYNIPSYNSDDFSFGNGILYIGAVGSTPTVDIGAVKGDSELSFDPEKIEVKQGSPMTLIKSYTVANNITFKVTGIEWNLDNIAHVLGAGVTSVNGASEVFGFGGDMDTSSHALRFVHRTPDGGTIDLHIFKAEGAGNLAVAIKEADIHEFPFEFKVLEGTLNFEGSEPAQEQKMIKIIKTPA